MKLLNASIFFTLLSFFSLGFAPAKKNYPNDITGIFWSPKKDAKIEIYLKGLQYFGKFTWLSNPRKDTKNPVKSLRNRDILGLELLSGFSFDHGVYSGGEIYDPETGKTYACKISLEGNKLKVRGFIGISLFGRTEYFERIK